MIACVRGCTVRRRHLAACPDPERCWGCEPRATIETTNLCSPCLERLRMMLTDAPTVSDWLTANLGGVGSTAAKDDWERAKSADDGSPAPLSVAIFDVRQLLGDQLSLWVDDLCANVRDMNDDPLTGPEAHTVALDARFLLRWLHRVATFDWIGDWWDELAETTSQAHALAPWRPAMKRHAGVPCPDCGAAQLATFGGEDEVTCLDCRLIMSLNGYNLWCQIMRDEAKATA